MKKEIILLTLVVITLISCDFLVAPEPTTIVDTTQVAKVDTIKVDTTLKVAPVVVDTLKK